MTGQAPSGEAPEIGASAVMHAGRAELEAALLPEPTLLFFSAACCPRNVSGLRSEKDRLCMIAAIFFFFLNKKKQKKTSKHI